LRRSRWGAVKGLDDGCIFHYYFFAKETIEDLLKTFDPTLTKLVISRTKSKGMPPGTLLLQVEAENPDFLTAIQNPDTAANFAKQLDLDNQGKRAQTIILYRASFLFSADQRAFVDQQCLDLSLYPNAKWTLGGLQEKLKSRKIGLHSPDASQPAETILYLGGLCVHRYRLFGGPPKNSIAEIQDILIRQDDGVDSYHRVCTISTDSIGKPQITRNCTSEEEISLKQQAIQSTKIIYGLHSHQTKPPSRADVRPARSLLAGLSPDLSGKKPPPTLNDLVRAFRRGAGLPGRGG
jgi:hypothetical protein